MAESLFFRTRIETTASIVELQSVVYHITSFCKIMLWMCLCYIFSYKTTIKKG